ncbi:hypothetical protein G3R49_00540 [Shewanella sp. WXL01]|uniref:Uncharacterized protein n=1 Tax=Shewanella maritima TaxID=2520507 RepID=A0A411PH51_9GAMM|nr:MULTISPECIES: hypothetical protein [Shewanella]NKF49063.1 hypothetical protein [Shewanella sp. WXL01]QBF82794.1 hypothetical protein EXU30_08895 [Shewanella maritima]
MNCYIHKTDKRLRVRSDFIRKNPLEVAKLIEQLEEVDAVQHIKHQKYAGSVAITFDDQEISCDDLLEILQSHQWLQEEGKSSFVESAVVAGTKTLVKGITGIALSRLVGPSISRVIMSV